MDRILVMRGGALGDFVLGLPALRTLREGYPQARLELIAPSAVLPLAASLVDVMAPLERAGLSSLFGDSAQLPEEVASRYRDLDLVVLWIGDAEGSVRRNFERLGARRVLWAPALPPPGRHATDHLLETLEPLGIGRYQKVFNSSGDTPDPARRGSAPSGHPLHPSLAADRPTVALHPGSGGDWKRWPVERFSWVIDRLAEAGVGVVVVQGPADVVVVERLLASLHGKPPPVVSGLRVEELAGLLSLASGYLGNDSGVTHLAAAVGTPTVAIFGPTDPVQWGPRGPRVVVLRAEQLCIPCGREKAALCRNRVCLSNVTVDQVLGVLVPLLL